MKYINIKPVCARFFALALLVLCGLSPRVATAQGLYTLTNGHLWWSNGLENQSDEAYRDPVAFDTSQHDASGNWVEVHPHGNDHVTHITEQGDTYLALDITTDPDHPAIVTKAHANFDLYCVWRRTGTTGYYYQEWYNATDHKTYRYYLIATSDEGLFVSRVEVGKPLDKSTYFYNWDYGAAAWEKPLIDGVQKNRYYWIMLQERERENNGAVIDEANREWTLSNHCYQRPEDIYYINYSQYAANPTANKTLKRYYDGVFDGVDEYHPVGNGALFMPVKEIPHDMEIRSIDIISTDPESEDYNKRYGLQRTEDAMHHTLGTGITIHDRATSAEGTPQTISMLDYAEGEDTAILTAKMKYKVEGGVNKVPMTVVPAYTEYIEETYRRGIHLNYRYRTEEEVFGSAGQAEQWNRTFYHYGSLSGDAAVVTTVPGSRTEATEVDTLYFYVDNRSLRYVEVDTIKKNSDGTWPLATTLRVVAPVNGEHTVQIYFKVRYKNGSEQRDTVQLTLKYNKKNVTPEAKNAPVVRGAVFGGGRMANVGGSTHIIVHSADSINTLYGGNDIAGWVQGDDGATIEIGTFYTNEEHPVHVGNIYGGGNGFYTYQGINAGYDEATGQHYNPYHRKQSTALMYSAYYFNGKVYPWNTLPPTYLTGTPENADALNRNQSAWSGFSPVVSHEFAYTPYYIGRPDLVDQAETGDDGDGTIPYIKTAHIKVGVPEGTTTIRNYNNTADSVVNTTFVSGDGDSTHLHNDYIIVDTVFGGARNAFIGVDANEGQNAEKAVSVDINGGTCYAVFGGNNVGGSVANKATVFVTVNDTKLIASDEEFEDTYLTGYGREFGIRYVYGGGNLVDGAHANVSIRGGLLDTVYLGGNNASVKNPVGTVECLQERDHHENGFGYDGHFICTNETYPNPKDFADVSPFQKYANTDGAFFEHYGPDNFSPEEGLYNIRCLFGGNNAADMQNMSFIQLHSGGISSVYGGGNRGDMVNDEVLSSSSIYAKLMKKAYDLDIENNDAMISDGWADIYGLATLPKKVGSIVTALHNSKIVCDYVFGGGRMGNIKNSCGIYLAGGTYGYVNGGNDVSGDVGSETGGGTYVVLDSNVLIVGDAIAGSDGYYHCEAVDDDGTLNGHYDDNELYDTYAEEGEAFSYDPFDDYVGMLFPSHNNVNLYLRGGLVLGNVVGGGVHTDVGFRNNNAKIKKIDTDPAHTETYGKRVELPLTLLGDEKSGSVHLMASGGHIVGNAFGGGFQSHIHGLAYLTLKGDVQIDGAFFCGNDCTGSINSFGAYVNMNDFTRYKAEHDGATDDEAMADAYRQMKATDGTTDLNSIDGSWNANYSAYLRIKDTPTISEVYGSGNGAYDYDGTRPEYEAVSFCEDKTGLGLTPKQSSTFIDIHTSGGYIGTVFGGGNGVGVEKDVVVLLNNTENTVHTVHTIFGGNNKDDMLDVVPDIRLKKGIVNTVYGGCNNGVMGASKSFTDATGKQLKGVSTHVVLESPDVTVKDTVFGGNRMSNVKGTTYVEVRNTKDAGVNYIFGGNDISGSIEGIARVDVSGGTVKNLFGGSNGRYDFVEIGDSLFNIYKIGFVDRHPNLFNGTDPDDDHILEDSLIATAARPDVDSTSINLWRGLVGVDNNDAGGVYGGGAMADCRATNVVVNDTASGLSGDGTITIKGSIYGGGMGNYKNLNARDLHGNRYGNVTEATHVHLHHAQEVSTAKAYGGGRGGDVYNTYVNTYKGWNTPFNQLFGGCWGADVHGTAHLDFAGVNLVRSLFGGNDFAGDVYKSIIDIHSGTFFNVYGGGNGDYPDNYYNGAAGGAYAVYAGTNYIRRPNNEYIEINFHNGNVDSCLYGGGKMGTTYTYKKDANREYVIGTDGRKVPDIDLTVANAHTNPDEYAHIFLNVHDGYFNRNIFAGARGRKDLTTPLVYGLKLFNMEGGTVKESVYGGSESVDDGYPAECNVPRDNNGDPVSDPTALARLAATTQRPSSILNITGGEVGASIYGAGYQGKTYGSAFLNIGVKAIDSCIAWRYNYAGATAPYASYKPTLSTDNLLLDLSVYAGANWGNNTGQADFSANGFYGGQTRVIIDGDQYNTANDPVSPLPEMNIHRSILGAGTSVGGGDIHSRIELRNYGAMLNCHPTKKIEAVQRADMFHLHNTAVEYTGTTDALSAYISTQYTWANLDTVRFRGYNVAEIDAPVGEVKSMHFYKDAYVAGELVKTTRPELTDNIIPDGGTPCAQTLDICDKEVVVNPDIADKQYTLLLLNNGIDFTVGNTVNNEIKYVDPGVVGFGYVTTPYGYSSLVSAMAKINYGAQLTTKGGFIAPCQQENNYQAHNGVSEFDFNLDWKEYNDITTENRKNVELPYNNYSSIYRVWEVGKGTRLREAALRAHTDPTKLPAEDMSILVNDAGGHQRDLAIATATFTLPSTDAGHFYMLDPSGFVLSGDNATITLVDSAWYINPTKSWNEVQGLYSADAADAYGAWNSVASSAYDTKEGVKEINQMPATTFGLIMVPEDKFAKTNVYGGGGQYYPEDCSLTDTYDSPVSFDAEGTILEIIEGDYADYTDLPWATIKNFRIKICDGEQAGIWIQDGSTLVRIEPTDESYDTYDNELVCGQFKYCELEHTGSGELANYSYTKPSQTALSHAGWPGSSNPQATYESLNTNLVISGNARVNNAYPYCSPVVEQGISGSDILPKMRFYLTYDKNFSSTFTGTIAFKLIEYDAAGNRVGPVDVKVYVQTIMEDFKDVTDNVLAMYNGGRSNTFIRKAILPALLERRELYITDVKWVPTDGDGAEIPDTAAALRQKFWLMDNADSVLWVDPVAANINTNSWYPHAYTGNQTRHNHHNRFAINVIPDNNITEDLSSSMGWERIVMEDINVYHLAFPQNVHERKKYIGWTGDASTGSATTLNLRSDANNNRGQMIGILDGRGSVALNVKLTFDGTRKYPSPEANTKGYVGKVVLGLTSYDDDGNEKSPFKLTIYVKTRLNGDTIYLASNDYVVRNNCLVQPYTKNSTYLALSQSEGVNADDDRKLANLMIGRSPNAYVQNFRHALKSSVYQEGDVLCILDKVKMETSVPVVIQGTTGPAIEVVRYDGHHHEFPDEGCVYRGPMIEVDGVNTNFTAKNIAFHGGSGAMITHVKKVDGNIQYVKKKESGHTSEDSLLTYDNGVHNFRIPSCAGEVKHPDTNRVFAPIIQVSNGGKVSLSNGVSVRYNWNAYGSETGQTTSGWPTYSKNMGAISVTSGGQLTMTNDVTFERNMLHTMPFDLSGDALYDVLHPGNGALYVDGGRVEFPEAITGTKVTITDNWLVDPNIHSDDRETREAVKWWTEETNEGETRWVFDPTRVTNRPTANVLLTRKGTSDLEDTQSDVMTISGPMAAGSRIKVSKWFPGVTTRDTLQIVKATGNLTLLNVADNNGNFLPDYEPNRVFYNAKVNNATIYFFRCATFRHQMLNVDLPLVKADLSGNYKGQDVLHYGILENNSCPTGGDTIIYRLQGGFAPYKYTWEMTDASQIAPGAKLRDYTTPYSNTIVQNALKPAAHDTSYYWASISDTLVTPAIDMAFGVTEKRANIKVTAVDATDVCQLSKDIQITLHKVGNLEVHQKWEPVTSPNGWKDTASVVTANRKTAVGDRYYRAVKVTPWVWTDASQGKITARVDGDNNDIVYNYIDDNYRHELEDQLFCEGDVIMLKTQPTYSGAQFLMWSFNPFNVNPAAFVVPPQDVDVIAYYGSNTYWVDTIDTPAEAGVKNASGYYYSSRPNADASYKMFSGKYEYDETKAGYVTTYSGDVHIYNENGLAWFISIVNGLNGNQARPFRYNNVYLHQKKMQRRDPNGNLVTSGGQPVMVDTCYDMKKFLWTPVGTRQYGFRGRFIGVGSGDADTTRLHHYEDKSTNPPTMIGDDAALTTWLAGAGHSVDNVDTVYDRVVIKNIVLNEPYMDYVGFFGLLEEAKCQGVALQDIFVRGGQYVGGFTAQSKSSKVDNCAVVSDPTKHETTSIIATNYVSGGMMGDASNSTVMNSKVEAKYTGNAIHSGGVTGTGKSDTIKNNVVRVNDQMNGIYVGYLTGDETAIDEDACVANLTAEVDMNSATPGYTINVSWQRLSPRSIYLGYCAGESWDGSPDDLQQVSGSSKTLHIPANTDNTVSGYTIYLKAECSDGTTTELSKYVSVSGVTPIPCPVYTVEGNISESEGQTSDQTFYELVITWDAVNYQYEVPTVGITAGYCVGTEWNANNATITNDGTNDGAYFPLQTLATSYVVGVYSDCDQQWFTRQITPNLCPVYTNVDAYYSTANDPETTTVVHHYATVSWKNTTSFEEPDNQITVFFCPVTPASQGSDNCKQMIVYADSNRNDDGNCYARLCIDDLITDNPNITDFTVTIKSHCSNNEYQTSLSTTGNTQGSNRRPRSNRNRQAPGRKTVTGGRSVIANNYVEVVNSGNAQRVGGIAGRAKNTDIMNNYVYGTVAGSETGGSVAAVMDQGTRAIDNFAANGTAAKTVGQQQGGMIRNSAKFAGQGNQVILDKRINGVNNLTRVLNRWVREQNANGGNYLSWRSDLIGENSGYPVFGTPDIIAAQGTQYLEGCDEVVINGVSYTRDSTFTVRFIDSVEMVDSTLTAHIVLHQSTHTEVSDTASLENGYSGYGFDLTPEELRLLEHTVDSTGRATLIVTDTFSTVYGCDSVVTLTLTYQTNAGVVEVEEGAPVQIYPNPTTSVVYVEAKAMSHVEVYDNEGRVLQDYDAYGKDQVVVDMTMYLSGVYYIRVHTPEEVIIQKVIKER